MSGEGKVVCVTGGAGYIASWLIKGLLLRGYTVKATVRDPNDPKKTEHLLALDGAKERLHLFRANLLEDGSFDHVVDGCVGVFHTASPVNPAGNDPQAELIDPAVKGTLNVLKSCAKVRSIKRVILTSSTAAVVYSGKPLNPETVVDETWYSDPEFCKEKKHWYPLSKILAEKAAWNFADENGIDMVVMNPTFVMGPLLQPTLNFSVEIVVNLVKAKVYPNAYYESVDVRDVADAHIQAFEIPSASGRYCLCESVTHFSEIVKIIRQHYPTLPLPEECVDGIISMPEFQTSTEKARTLGINFIPLDVSIKDTIESLKEKALLSIENEPTNSNFEVNCV